MDSNNRTGTNKCKFDVCIPLDPAYSDTVADPNRFPVLFCFINSFMPYTSELYPHSGSYAYKSCTFRVSFYNILYE